MDLHHAGAARGAVVAAELERRVPGAPPPGVSRNGLPLVAARVADRLLLESVVDAARTESVDENFARTLGPRTNPEDRALELAVFVVCAGLIVLLLLRVGLRAPDVDADHAGPFFGRAELLRPPLAIGADGVLE